MRREEGGGAGRDSERVGCLGATSGGGFFVFLLLAQEHAKKGGGHTRKRVDMCGDPWKDKGTASLRFVYTPVFIAS